MTLHGFTFATVLILLGLSASLARAEPTNGWNQWLVQFKARAAQEGVSARTIASAFDGLEEDESVVALDRKQPENKITFERYLRNTVNERRIRIGRELLAEYREELKTISEHYRVQPEFIVALWGIESDYGNNKGNFSVVQSLATLAYEGRRAEFFGRELIAALKIIDDEKIEASDLSGSWAGAMGNCQFMPSTYLNYAVDADNDGRRDIWDTPMDTFASIANYLRSIGWNGAVGWGAAVAVPDNVREAELSLKQAKPASHWSTRGFRFSSHGNTRYPTSENHNSPLYGVHLGGDEYFLVNENFQVLLQWNRSRYFATSVGLLADALGE